ncbi:MULTISPECIES: MFS transporter [unclassified Bordetella]|uniref:MFS transporter n=1 Tax=unclassified Bordetella TaxID=2630031 RepID=UPI0013225A12|nr:MULTISPECIES: MFS transporter [unclassified Bordetella]MVW71120.1 MFS transporter [Bordetella sp. 15P40C-2]MVW80689.1 MFS transporter [Bordetella sp. 02P26C-1]
MNDAVLSAPVALPVDEEKRLFRKITWRLIPFLMFCYVAAYIDRVNVGFAKLQMLDELGFSETVYGLGAGIFFIGYFLLEVPSNLALRKVGARVWIARIMLTWGVISAAFVWVTTPTQYYVLRFLLGAAEAGFYPGVIYYLMSWYPSRRRSQIIALFMVAIPVAGILGGPISGWIIAEFDKFHGYSGWQWMFFLEALPSIALGVATFFVLDSTPDKAKWLTASEKAYIARELEPPTNPHARMLTSVGHVFRDPRMLLLSLIYFCVIMGQYGLTFWMPTLIKASGVTGVVNIGLLSAVPYIFAIIAMLGFGRSSDRTGERRWHLIIPMLMGATGYMVVAIAGNNIPLALVGLSLAAAGVITPGPLFWALPSAFLVGSAAAAGVAAINAFAGLAGFVSPYFIGWLRDLTQSSTIAMYVSAAVLLAGAMMILLIPAKVVNR